MMAAQIAAALGGKRQGHGWRCRRPVHDSRGPTLALRAGERGLIVCCHAGCEARDVLTELHRRSLLAGAVGRDPAPIEIGPNSIAWHSAEVEAWRESRPRRADRAPELAEGAAP